MASSYTDLGTELMVTGENAGTWGTKTNTNIEILEDAIRGYATQALTSGGTVTVVASLIVPVNFIILCARVAPVDPSETDNVVV